MTEIRAQRESEDSISETRVLLGPHVGWERRKRREKQPFPRRRYRFRWCGSRGALMVLAWNFLVFSYQYKIVGVLLSLVPGYHEWSPWRKMSASLGLDLSLPLLLYPLAGWLADVKLGRYRVLKTSIWILWASSILLLIYLLVKEMSTHPFFTRDIVILPISIIYLGNTLGLAGFQANIIPFGMDQMENGSAEQYSSFIHWYYWTRNFSFGLILDYFLHSVISPCPRSHEENSSLKLVVLLVEMGLLSLALLLDIFFPRVLIKTPQAINPLMMVLKVTGFVVRHRQPVGQRSALTYERGYYSRSDLATIPYGGPFEVEDVESVKTFWRMILFLAAVASAIIPIYTVNRELSSLVGPHLRASHCPLTYFILNVSNPLIFSLLLPVHELIVYPLFHKYILSMLRRAVVGYVLGLVAVIGATIIMSVPSRSFSSFFTESGEFNGLCEWMVFIPILVSTFSEMLVFIPAFEFLCAQSPYNMRGLLIGSFYSLQGLAAGLSSLLLLLFAEFPAGNQQSLKSDFWFNFVILLLTVVGVIVFSGVVRWYKKRERDYLGRECVDHRAILEAYYDRSK